MTPKSPTSPSSSRTGSLNTRLVRGGEPQPPIHGAVTLPIFQSSTYEHHGDGMSYDDLRYARLSNSPTHDGLHAKLAAAGQSEAALVTSSGMAAISTALLSVLGQGDHLLAQDTLYGGTLALLNQDLPRLGIDVSFVDSRDPGAWEAALRPNTKAFYVEALSNPLLQLSELHAVVDFARAHDLVSLVDNTFLSPACLCTVPLGFDLELHSASKYMNGHTDLIAGAVLGSSERVHQVRLQLNHLGGSLDPHACFLLYRGLKTLGLRVERQCANALALAHFLTEKSLAEKSLKKQPRVARVIYPGLDQGPQKHPQAELAQRLLPRGYGGMLAFELAGGPEAAETLFQHLQIATIAPSLGGVETLVTRPATTSHASMDPDARRAAGIADGLVRMSVGIEDASDLIEDFEQALDRL